jgi:hypothetical protein
MEFKTTNRSIIFEFVYKSFVFSFADYTQLQTWKPEGKISISIERQGTKLSSKTNERIAAFINNRIQGSAWVVGDFIEIKAWPHDQIMYHLMSAVDIIIPG